MTAGCGAALYGAWQHRHVILNRTKSFLGWMYGQQQVEAMVEAHVQSENFYAEPDQETYEDNVIMAGRFAYIEEPGPVRHNGVCVLCQHVRCVCSQLFPEGVYGGIPIRDFSHYVVLRVGISSNVGLQCRLHMLRRIIAVRDLFPVYDRPKVNAFRQMLFNFRGYVRERVNISADITSTSGNSNGQYSLIRRILFGDDRQLKPLFFPSCGDRPRKEELVQMMAMLDKHRAKFFEIKRETLMLTVRGHQMTSADRTALSMRVVRSMKDYDMPGESEFVKQRDKYRLTSILIESLCAPTINQQFFTLRPEDHQSI